MEKAESSTHDVPQSRDINYSLPSISVEDSDLREYQTVREKLVALLHSHKFQVGVIVLVVLDCLLVISELLLDLRILELHGHEESGVPSHIAPKILHYVSIAILSIFIIEVILKVYALGMEFFHHKLEVFDAFVVFLSFSFDVAFHDEESVKNAFGLVIVLRLWRVARILNGVVLSVKTQTQHKLQKERRLREGVEGELHKYMTYSQGLECEIAALRDLLTTHGISDLPKSAVKKEYSAHNTVKVVAEVNRSEI